MRLSCVVAQSSQMQGPTAEHGPVNTRAQRAHDCLSSPPRLVELCSHAQASRPSRSKLGVEPLEFDAGVGGCELPIGFGVMLVSMGPGCDLAFEG